MTSDAFTRPSEDVVRELDVDAQAGLTETEASKRLSEHGPNRLREAQRKGAWTILIDQFRSLIVGFLFAATAVALVTGDHLEAIAIGWSSSSTGSSASPPSSRRCGRWRR